MVSEMRINKKQSELLFKNNTSSSVEHMVSIKPRIITKCQHMSFNSVKKPDTKFPTILQYHYGKSDI